MKPMHLWEFANLGALSEKKVEAMCVSLYRSAGVWVVKFSQPHKSSQTLGIPDLLCYWRTPVDWVSDTRVERWWHEVKAKKGKLSEHQQAFHMKLQDHGEHVVVGGLNMAIGALQSHRVARFAEMEGHW